MARSAPPQGLAKDLRAPDLVNHLTKVMANAAAEVIDGLARPPLVTDATDAALQERFMQRRVAAQHSGTTPAATSRISVFYKLAHRLQSPPEGGSLASPFGNDATEGSGMRASTRERSRTQ